MKHEKRAALSIDRFCSKNSYCKVLIFIYSAAFLINAGPFFSRCGFNRYYFASLLVYHRLQFCQQVFDARLNWTSKHLQS
jgi:hypothetical protein